MGRAIREAPGYHPRLCEVRSYRVSVRRYCLIPVMTPYHWGTIPDAKVARYIQVENRIRALVRFELADKIPMAK